jgi:hypothetical protein
MGVGKPRGILAGRKLKTKRRMQKYIPIIIPKMERQRLQQASFGIAVEEPFHGCLPRQGPGRRENGRGGQTAQLSH